MRASGVLASTIAARDATDEELARVHAASYIELVRAETDEIAGVRYLSTGDTMVDAGSLPASIRAAGGAIEAARACAAGNEAVFALIRPPGHHAEPACGMGFCLFNNVAIAARAFAAEHGGRVLVADFDYHHGNGTEAVAGEGLSYLSTHAFPAYPGTGARSYRRGNDLVVNVPLAASGVSTEAFVAVWQYALAEVARLVRPDVLLVSAGFDYVAGDGVGDLGVDVSAASPIASAIADVADRYCSGSVAYMLEGGYSIEALTRSIDAIAKIHDGGRAQTGTAEETAIPPETRQRLRAFFDSQGSL